jgi:hypothetical protein
MNLELTTPEGAYLIGLLFDRASSESDPLSRSDEDLNDAVYRKLERLVNGPPVLDGRPYLRPGDEVESVVGPHSLRVWQTLEEAMADGATRQRVRSCATAIRRGGVEIWRKRS